MIEFFSTYIAEVLMMAVTFVVGGLWSVLSKGFGDLKKDVEHRKVMWDEEMIRINHKFDELLADHVDIKRDIGSINKELTDKVEKIMVDHASHERDQAVQLELLRDIKAKAEQKRGLFG